MVCNFSDLSSFKYISPGSIDKGVAPFTILQLIGLIFVIIFPTLVTWLPSVAY